MTSPLRTRPVRLGVILAAVLGTGCQAEVGGRALLAEPPKDQPRLSSYEPARPYRTMAPGVLSRQVLDARSAAAAPGVDVLELLIAPGQRAADVSLPGGAVLEVRAGHGVLTSGGKREDVKTGSIFALSQGASFSIENTGELPITIRALVITAR